MNLPSGESLVRQIVFGQRYFEEKFGQRCEEVWIPDVFGYPAGLPQVFAAGGMRRFVTQKLSWNKQNRFPHNTFWWEGLDGTRVLTHFPPVDTYNAEITPAEVAYSVGNFQDHGWSSVSLMPFGHGDGGGGPTREMLERARRLAAADPRVTRRPSAHPTSSSTRSRPRCAPGRRCPCGAASSTSRRIAARSPASSARRPATAGANACSSRPNSGRRRSTGPPTSTISGVTCSRSSSTTSCPGSSIAWVHADAEAVFERVGGELEERIAGLLDRARAARSVTRQPGRCAGRRRGGARRSGRHCRRRRRRSRRAGTASRPTAASRWSRRPGARHGGLRARGRSTIASCVPTGR